VPKYALLFIDNLQYDEIPPILNTTPDGIVIYA
jgi:hypothetical protein